MNDSAMTDVADKKCEYTYSSQVPLHRHRLVFICTSFLLLANFAAMADESPQERGQTPGTEHNHASADYPGGVRTMGGRQFWGDKLFFHGWRIQHNVVLGQHRLLDPQDKRHASGTLQECRDKLEQVRTETGLPRMSGKAVVLLHGIGRSSKSFFSMAKGLEEDGYTVVGFDYPSTRISIEDSAEYLHSVLQSLEGIESIDVVCHSMGGLLLRAYLMKHEEHRFRRAVMLGVPNKGAQMADVLKGNPLFKAILGPAGQQLTTDENGLIGHLPVPSFPFAVVAGGRSAPRGYNPILPGDNDSTVTVSSTRLPGAADFVLIPVIHSFLMNHPDSVALTRHFFRHGRLLPDREPQPISRDDVTVVE